MPRRGSPRRWNQQLRRARQTWARLPREAARSLRPGWCCAAFDAGTCAMWCPAGLAPQFASGGWRRLDPQLTRPGDRQTGGLWQTTQDYKSVFAVVNVPALEIEDSKSLWHKCNEALSCHELSKSNKRTSSRSSQAPSRSAVARAPSRNAKAKPPCTIQQDTEWTGTGILY